MNFSSTVDYMAHLEKVSGIKLDQTCWVFLLQKKCQGLDEPTSHP